MACVLFPNQRERKIAVSEVISLMESLTLPWDQNSTQKPVPEMQKRQTTYHKIQEMVPLQGKIKEDKRIRIKDFTKKDSIDHQSTSIKDQSRPSSIGLAPSEAHAPIQHITTTIRHQFCIHSHRCLHLFIYIIHYINFCTYVGTTIKNTTSFTPSQLI